MTIELYHGSHDADFSGPSKSFFYDFFGGVFAARDSAVAGSHGEHIFVCNIDDDAILTDYELNYECDYSEVTAAVAEGLSPQWNLEGEALECIVDAALADYIFGDRERELLGFACLGDTGWELQRLRGVIATALGFKAVEMTDEHGTTYLVLPGVKFKAKDSMSR